MKVSKKTLLIGIVVVVLVVALLFSTYLNIKVNNSLQACSEKNRGGSSHMGKEFHHCVYSATSINEPNEDNIEAVIEGFFREMWDSWMFLYGLRLLNPELMEYQKPLYFIDRFIFYTFLVSESSTGEPNVRSVLKELLLGRAKSSGNYSILITAFKELNQTSFRKMRELSFEVAESFYTPFNATRLDNTINIVQELESISSQWTDKYENV